MICKRSGLTLESMRRVFHALGIAPGNYRERFNSARPPTLRRAPVAPVKESDENIDHFVRTLACAFIARWRASLSPPVRRHACADPVAPGIQVLPAPGTCPDCGMPLVEAGAANAPAVDPGQKKVAILVFNGVEVVDFTGPYKIFGAAGCDVYTVASSRDPMKAMASTGSRHTFADAPEPDVLVIPGGGICGAKRDDATRVHQAHHEHATHTLTVCNGAFILANTGLLDGLSATTTYGNIPKLAAQYPKITWFVTVVTSTTARSSPLRDCRRVDGALHVIARLFGTGLAQEVHSARKWTETGRRILRAALADHDSPSRDGQPRRGISSAPKVIPDTGTSSWKEIRSWRCPT
jgi:putative intracellular protease/amidase